MLAKSLIQGVTKKFAQSDKNFSQNDKKIFTKIQKIDWKYTKKNSSKNM